MAFALRDGLGVGALPLWAALPWLRDGTLVRVLPAYRLSEMQIRAIYTSQMGRMPIRENDHVSQCITATCRQTRLPFTRRETKTRYEAGF